MQGFKFEYAEHGDIPLELFWRGMISLTLTAVNILCIIIVGVLMLLVKQVTKNKQTTRRPTQHIFDHCKIKWTHYTQKHSYSLHITFLQGEFKSY